MPARDAAAGPLNQADTTNQTLKPLWIACGKM